MGGRGGGTEGGKEGWIEGTKDGREIRTEEVFRTGEGLEDRWSKG